MSRKFAPESKKLVDEIEFMWGNFLDFSPLCTTYPKHGTTGEGYGIDIQIAPWGQWANHDQHYRALQALSWLRGNRDRFGIIYMIYNDRYYYPIGDPASTDTGNGMAWRWYDASKWKGGSPDPISKRHGDHIHLTLPQNFVYEEPALYA